MFNIIIFFITKIHSFYFVLCGFFFFGGKNAKAITNFTTKKLINNVVRLVHGLVRVRFMPNLELTRPDQMVGISTRHRSVWLIGSGKLDVQRRAVGSVGVGDLKIGQNPAF